MNFKYYSTAERLVWLADLIADDLREKFWQPMTDTCVIGLGTRVNEDGTLPPTSFSRGTAAFATRYGVTHREAHALLLSTYAGLGIDEAERKMHKVTADDAVRILYKLANKYARENKPTPRPWTPFYYNANQAWGWVDSPEEWDRIVLAHFENWHFDTREEVVNRLLQGKSNMYGKTSTRPDFGLYSEYEGDDTLRAFAERNGMSLA